MTASDAIQYSFEGDRVEEVDIVRSFFTNALVQGLENGEADLDRDGRISFDELYDYVYRYVKDKTSKQTPRKWALGVEGDIFIAQTPSKSSKDSIKSPSRESLLKLLEDGKIEEFNRLRKETEIALKLHKIDLSARILTDADLTEADLSGAKLVKTKLTSAILKGAKLQGADLREAKLIDADLYGANLSGANLTRTSLRGANLRGMVDFSGSDLTDADLRGVDLAGIVSFANAILINTDFTGATTDKALIDFRGAKAENIKGIQIPSDDNEYLNDLISFSGALKEQFTTQNIPADNLKPIEESMKDLTAEIKDIPAKEEMSSAKRKNVNTKLIDLAKKVIERLPQRPQTVSSFGALSSFNKVTEKKVEQIAENVQKQVAGTGSKSPSDIKQIDNIPNIDYFITDFLTYENARIGIKIQYPADWKLYEKEYYPDHPDEKWSQVVGFSSPIEVNTHSKLENVAIYVKELPSQKMTIYAYANKQISRLKSPIKESTQTTIAGSPAHKVLYRGYIAAKIGYDILEVLEIWTVKGNNLYTVRCTAKPHDFSSYASIFQKMMDSFEIT